MPCDVYAPPVIYITGIASWYCCGSVYSPFCNQAQNSGACGTCDNYSLACAWPYLVGHPPNYAASCRPELPYYACGDTFRVYSYCTGYEQCVYVADHGPNTDNFCGISPPCRGDIPCQDRIIDLTPAAFMSIASMSSGLTLIMTKDYPGC